METKDYCEEKRNSQRVHIDGLTASFKLLDPRTWSTYHEKSVVPVSNISMGGVALDISHEMPLHAPIGIDVTPPGSEYSVRVFGRIAWIHKDKDNSHYSMGVSFSWWKREEEKKQVFSLVEEHSNNR